MCTTTKAMLKAFGCCVQRWPNQPGVQYYGRGPMQLSWNYNYGQFSNVFGVSSYNSKMELLKDPDSVAREGYIAMAAGIWFYMTPQDPKPSMHDVMTGNFEPNSIDNENNIKASFGTTTNIINGGLECGYAGDKQRSRGEYYTEWLKFFNLPAEGDLECANQPNRFPDGGSGDVAMYYDESWGGETACQVVTWMTQYSVAARDDYKRCVCDKFGAGEADCPLADGEPEPDPEPAPEPSPEPEPQPDPSPPDEWKTWADLQEIRDNPHYSESSYSRTLYQVDRELSFLESKLTELYTIAYDNKLIQ